MYSGRNLIHDPSLSHNLFLLGIPDICHELGHIIFSNSPVAFQSNFFAEVSSYIKKGKQRRIREGAPPQYQLMYDRLEAEWKDHWTTEFICDVLATFLVGPAFGRAHLRLTISLDSPNIFRPGFGESNIHPCAEARTRAIIRMLTTVGLDKDSKTFNDYWQKYISATNTVMPMEYELSYPDILLETLAIKVNTACIDSGLQSYKTQSISGDHTNIPILMNEAWIMFSTDPKNYPDWEADKVANLRDELNRGA